MARKKKQQQQPRPESSGPPGSLIVEFGYVLVRNKFSTYMYYIVLLSANHWKFDIPLIALEKKSCNIYLVLLSFPLQGRKFWT